LNTLHTLRCPEPTCSNHYTSEHGYFSFIKDESPNFGNRDTKLTCGAGLHQVKCKVVTELDGVLQWACPDEHCKGLTIRYDSTDPTGVELKNKISLGYCAVHSCGGGMVATQLENSNVRWDCTNPKCNATVDSYL
jgi:hypothetical protein